MSHTENSYPSEHLRKELKSLGLPEEKHDRESLKQLLSRCLKLHDYAQDDPNTLAEVLIYLTRKNLFDLRG